jgi:hypothetical protein
LRRTAVLAMAALATATLGVATASAQTRAPALRVHAIFAGGQETNFHAGQVLMADVRNAGGRRITQVCWSPAPIARPACSASRLAAPQPGPNRVTATLDDGTTFTQTFTAHRPATRVGGRLAVPATITCADLTLFGNYDRRRQRSLDPRGTVRRGARVALYNVIGPGKIFMWDYATNVGGFASRRCAATENPADARVSTADQGVEHV